jgi:hypothetical protein
VALRRPTARPSRAGTGNHGARRAGSVTRVTRRPGRGGTTGSSTSSDAGRNRATIPRLNQAISSRHDTLHLRQKRGREIDDMKAHRRGYSVFSSSSMGSSRSTRTRLGLHPTGGGRPYSGDSAILIGCDRIGPPETDPETDPGIMRRSGPLHPTDRIFYTWHFLFSCAAAGRVWGTVVLDFRGTVASGDIDSVYPSHRDLSGPKQRPGPPAGRNAGESPTEARSRTISDRAIP